MSSTADFDRGEAEYSSARKLVLRAAKRESALSSVGSSGASGDAVTDFSSMPLKPDHIQRPCWTCPDGYIYLEAFSDLYVQAYDFLVAIAEPVARPEFIHVYKLTPYSLYAAVATQIPTESIITVLDRLSKNALPRQVEKFVRDCTQKYGKAKLLLRDNKFYVESEHPTVLRELLRDPTIAEARVVEDIDSGAALDEHGFLTSSKAEEMKENLIMLNEPDDSDDDDDNALTGTASANDRTHQQQSNVVVSFQIKSESVEQVRRQAIEMDYPLLDEYEFRADSANPNVPQFDLKPQTRIRRYQERSLAKMFGNGRARSGIIVLPVSIRVIDPGRNIRDFGHSRYMPCIALI